MTSSHIARRLCHWFSALAAPRWACLFLGAILARAAHRHLLDPSSGARRGVPTARYTVAAAGT